MIVTLDMYNEVQRIDAICVGMGIPNLAHQTITAIAAGMGRIGKTIECTAPDIAHGLIGHSGALIDGVGLQCTTFPWSGK
jgi:hypothetical protein